MSVNNGNYGAGKLFLLLLNCALLGIGNCGGPLTMRLYFLRGGNRIWFSSWINTGGWPLTFLPLAAAYFHRRRRQGPAAKPVLMTRNLFAAAAAIGVINGLDSFLYAYGMSKLPVTTQSLIYATELAFTAAFAFLLVRQRFTAFTLAAIALLTVGAGILAHGASGDRPAGEASREYVIGFVVTVLAAALYGFILPVIELTYVKARQAITYGLVLEIQVVMCFFSTAFCTAGMLVNKDFQAIPKEAREFELGEDKYYIVVACSAVVWQFFFIGSVGVICYGSSLWSGVIITATLSVTEVFAVVFYGEKFRIQKAISLALSLLGFVSYFYGEIKSSSKKEELLQIPENNI
ncbi:PREDICTED: purine permease 1-like [Ipomoea nil]|uniref:purine permease 1-like n=1 Tax=Ipomoea nil TaxID=35883 RepID=UPI000900F6E1|nr:PREDICTED: purine permease 1-like [Ipomoea nil]XP_019155813.1 PREDICTED: purine permease 1-like [Ipomoea nil]